MIVLAGVDYRQVGDTQNRVPNARFSSRTAGWNLFGPNLALDVAPQASSGDGLTPGIAPALRVRALADDVVRVNSPQFAVGGREGFRRIVPF
jgi:hypothetical protein